jgi:hypothetical protein
MSQIADMKKIEKINLVMFDVKNRDWDVILSGGVTQVS